MASRSNKSTPILTILLILLLAGLGYLLFDRAQLKKQLNDATVELENKAQIHQELEISFNEATASLDSLKTDNVHLNSLIEEQKFLISEQKEKINRLIYVDKNYRKAKAEIASLKNMAANYIAEINQLKSENKSLLEKNASLKNETQLLTKKVEQTVSEKKDLETKKKKLETFNQSLVEEREVLNDKVNLASAIRVNNIKPQGYKIKKNGKIVERKAASYIDQLIVCFETEANQISEKKEEEFFMCITSPLGELLEDTSVGSGTFVSSETQRPVKYTVSGVMPYNQDIQEACMEWKPTNGKFEKGIYAIEIYNKGYLVGKSNYKMK